MPKPVVKPAKNKPQVAPQATNGKATKRAKPATAVVERLVIYPELETKFCLGDDALSAADAMKVLGWEEIPTGAGNAEYMFLDRNGKKIRCTNCNRQRKFTQENMEKCRQDLLNRKWADSRNGPGQVVGGKQYPRTINNQSIGIGRTKEVVDGRHRLVGLVFAHQDWEKSPHWQELWEGKEPTMECLIVFGLDESDQTLRTIDNTLPRGGGDILYASRHFADSTPKDRNHICRAASYALAMLWDRSGAGQKGANNFTPRRTNSELEDYLDRHPRMVQCLKHIWEEDKNGAVSKWLSPGYSSALCYFMGSSHSDGDSYRNMDTPSEQGLDWELWERACAFWALLGTEGNELQAVRAVLSGLKDHISGNHGPLAERLAVLARAWNVFADGDTPTEDDLQLRYMLEYSNGKKKAVIGHRWELARDLGQDSFLTLMDNTTFGGIDLGDPKLAEEDEEDASPEAIEERKAEVRRTKHEEHKRKLLELRQERQEQGKELTPEEELEVLREHWPQHLLLFKKSDGSVYKARGDDARNVSKICKIPVRTKVDGQPQPPALYLTEITAERKDECIIKLRTAGYRVAIVEQHDGLTRVSPLEQVDEPTEAPPAEPEQVAAEPTPAPKPAKKKIARK